MAAMDISHLATTYSIPEKTLISLRDEPKQDQILFLFQTLQAFAKSHDELKSEKLKSDVEFEAAVRSGDSRVRQLKDSLDKSLKEIETLRRSVNESENARNTVASELQQLKTSTSTSTSQLQALQSRIETLEASNRDKLALLDSKSQAYDDLSKELSTQQQKIIDLRREISELEQKLQKAENVAMTSKFKEQNLQQEIELLKKSNDWHEDELKRRTTDHTKFRKEKSAQIAELQRLNEEATQTVESLKRTESTLRSRVDDGIRKIEDLHSRIHTLEEDAARAQDSFNIDIGNAQRLAQLQETRAITAQSRLRELEDEKQRIQEDSADEIGQLQVDLENEAVDKQALESRITELENHVEKLESEANNARNAPITPRRGAVNGSSLQPTPVRSASPGIFASPATARLKGLNMTQLYSEHTQLKQELQAERRRSEKLKETVDEMIQDLERHQPEFEEIRLDRERLQINLEELSTLLDETKKDRDSARKEARQLEGQADGFIQEAELLRQQLRDLSTQIKILLVEADAQEKGLENLTPMDQELLQRAALGEIDVSDLEGMTDTSKLISERLTVFRNIAQLQDQNVKLMHLTRKLGDEMEGEEAKAKQNKHAQEVEELYELRDVISKHSDEMKSINLRAESYMRERDMFRRMLTHRGQIPPGTDVEAMFGDSIHGNQLGVAFTQSTNSQLRSSTNDQSQQLNLAIKELQNQYDVFRQESATDQSALRDQLNAIVKEKNELQSQTARLSSQITLAQERYDLLHTNYSMLKTENGEIQKRNSSLAELTAKQDLRTQQVAEELIEARTMTESLRNENSNLKSERALHKKIEERQNEDHQQSLEERSRLNKMITDLQSLQNERELQDSETKRRLQTRADELESELSTAKRKLDDEVDKSNKAFQRREFEQEQNQTRIEDLLKGLSNTREELVEAKTQRDQLQARVDELKIELRNAEEKTLVLQPLLSSRPAANNDQENRLSNEQELALQVADLKRDLDLAKNDLLQATEHIEQYKSISQAAEEELQTLNDTSDQYRDEMDRIIQAKELQINDLKKRVEDVLSELTSTNTELSELRSKQDEGNSRFNEQKSILDSEIARLHEETDRLTATSKLHQADLKAQAEIAQSAQQSYEDELLKHADAAKQLQSIRTEYNSLKTEIAGYKAEAEASKATLQDNEESWAESKVRYERELTELKTRREDVISQNRRLHQQFETVSAQIAAMKESHSSASIPGGELAKNRDDIITWIKNEKEIVEVQLEMQTQYAKQYKQQLERKQTQLDEAVEKLNRERQSQIDSQQSSMSHSKLMESVNQLNLLRESNSSLRNESRQAQTQLTEKIKEVENLTSQLEPLKLRVREVENKLENNEGEMRLLQEDRDRWQKRTQDILTKYDRVDPAEMEALKGQIDALNAEKVELVKEKDELKTLVEGIDARIKMNTEELTAEFDARRKTLIEQAKSKARSQNGIIQERTTQLEAAQKELEEVKQELANTKQALEQTQSTNTITAPEPQIPETANEKPDSSAAELAQEKSRSSALEQEIQGLQARIAELEMQINNLQTTLESERKTKDTLQAMIDGNTENQAESSVQLESLKTQLDDVKNQLEAQQNKAVMDAGGDPEEIESLITARRTELEQEYESRSQAAERLFQERTDKMKSALNNKLKDLRQKDQEEAAAKHAAELEQLKVEHASEVERTKAEAGTSNGTTGEMTDVEAKDLVAKNSTIQAIVKRNIVRAVEKKEEQLRDEYEKKIDTAAQEAKLAHDNAISLEQKRQNVKHSIADKKIRDAQAKIQVVETAANQTPTRAVKEVWDIAKTTKAIVAPPSQASTAATAPAATPTPTTTTTSTPKINPAPVQQVQNQAQLPKPVIPAPRQIPAQLPSQAPAQLPAQVTAQGTKPAVTSSSQVPITQTNQAGRGRGSGIPSMRGRGGQATGIPRGGAQQSGLPRGGARGGRGGNRGGGAVGGGGAGQQNNTASSTNNSNQQAPELQVGTPGSPLNPTAKQFTPGGNNNKRPHEGSSGADGNAEKRVRSEN